MNMANRANRARKIAGLSLGQAAKLLGASTNDVREVEGCAEVPTPWIPKLCELYRIRPEWLTGAIAQHDYDAVDRMKGAESLTSHDRDAIAEFFALRSGCK